MNMSTIVLRCAFYSVLLWLVACGGSGGGSSNSGSICSSSGTPADLGVFTSINCNYNAMVFLDKNENTIADTESTVAVDTDNHFPFVTASDYDHARYSLAANVAFEDISTPTTLDSTNSYLLATPPGQITINSLTTLANHLVMDSTHVPATVGASSIGVATTAATSHLLTDKFGVADNSLSLFDDLAALGANHSATSSSDSHLLYALMQTVEAIISQETKRILAISKDIGFDVTSSVVPRKKMLNSLLLDSIYNQLDGIVAKVKNTIASTNGFDTKTTTAAKALATADFANITNITPSGGGSNLAQKVAPYQQHTHPLFNNPLYDISYDETNSIYKFTVYRLSKRDNKLYQRTCNADAIANCFNDFVELEHSNTYTGLVGITYTIDYSTSDTGIVVLDNGTSWTLDTVTNYNDLVTDSSNISTIGTLLASHKSADVDTEVTLYEGESQYRVTISENASNSVRIFYNTHAAVNIWRVLHPNSDAVGETGFPNIRPIMTLNPLRSNGCNISGGQGKFEGTSYDDRRLSDPSEWKSQIEPIASSSICSVDLANCSERRQMDIINCQCASNSAGPSVIKFNRDLAVGFSKDLVNMKAFQTDFTQFSSPSTVPYPITLDTSATIKGNQTVTLSCPKS